MTTKPKILLVNDDGADASGLWVLFEKIESIANPVIVAPMREQSAGSHAVTVRRPMALEQIERDGQTVGYRLDGTPADCVKLALVRLFRDQVRMVISGINWGANVGHSILYSGTVAAALEAAMYGLPAMAVSLRNEHESPLHLETAAHVARQLAFDILAHGLPPGVILNVNVPDLPLSELAGAALTRQGRENYIDLFEISPSNDGTDQCMNLGDERRQSAPGDHPLDDLTLNERRVSITPLHFDLTSQDALEVLRERVGKLNLLAETVFPSSSEA